MATRTELPAGTDEIDKVDSGRKPSARRWRSGRIVLLALAGGLSAWTVARIYADSTAKANVLRDSLEARERALRAPGGRTARTTRPTPGQWRPEVIVEGTLAPNQSAAVAFEVGGRLTALHAVLGEKVAAGQLLATLDDERAGTELEAARAKVRSAQAALALAQDEQRRTSVMLQRGSATEASGQAALQRSAIARAQHDLARAEAKLAARTLAAHRLKAPFSGSILRAPDGVGGMFGPGAPAFELVDVSRLRLRATIRDRDLALVSTGSAVELETDSGRVRGVVTAVLASADAQTRRVQLEAIVDNTDEKLRAGTFVRATVRGATEISVLKLPPEVLRPGTKDEVLILEGRKLAARRVLFSLGPSGDLLVREGIAPQDDVLLAPSTDDHPGDQLGAAHEARTAEASR